MNKFILFTAISYFSFVTSSMLQEIPKNLTDVEDEVEFQNNNDDENTSALDTKKEQPIEEKQFDSSEATTFESSNNEMIIIDDIPQEFNNWYGILSSEDGGLGWNMWGQTKHKDAYNLLKNLNHNISSNTLKSLMNRILLSRAKSPIKENKDERTDKKELSFYKEKIRIFSLLGLTDSINSLDRSIPSSLKDSSLLQNTHDIRFKNLDLKHACNNIQGQTDAFSKNFFHRKLLIGCKIAFNKTNEASLAIELLENEMEAEDKFLNFSRNYIEENKYTNNSVQGINEKELQIIKLMSLKDFKHAKKVFSEDKQKLDILTYDLKLYSKEKQIEALERLVSQGFFSGTILREEYIKFLETNSDESTINDLDLQNINSVLLRAKLFNSSIKSENPAERAKFLNILWKKANEINVYKAIALATSDITLSIIPDTNLSWFIYPAVKNLLISEKTIEAKNWLFYKSNDFLNRAAVDINFCRFLILLYIKDPNSQYYSSSMPTINDLLDILLNDIEIEEKQLFRLLVTLRSLNYNLPAGIWRRFIKLKNNENSKFLKKDFTVDYFVLEDAILKKNKAESAMMAINILSYFDDKIINMQNLYKGISALNEIGLEKEARNYAFEINFNILK